MAKVTILSKQDREGVIVTPSYRISTNIKDICEFHVLLDREIAEDESFEMALDVYVSDDGTKWRYDMGIVYRGYRPTAQTPAGIPGIGALSRNYKGKYVHGRIVLNKRVSIGAEVEDKTIEETLNGLHTG